MTSSLHRNIFRVPSVSHKAKFLLVKNGNGCSTTGIRRVYFEHRGLDIRKVEAYPKR